MTEPRTAAGRALLADVAIPAWWSVTPENDPVSEIYERILAIEAEAAAPAEGLREAWLNVEPFVELVSDLTEAHIAWDRWQDALAAQPAEGLDVERLMIAWTEHLNHERNDHVCDPIVKMCAHKLAAEYARLMAEND